MISKRDYILRNGWVVFNFDFWHYFHFGLWLVKHPEFWTIKVGLGFTALRITYYKWDWFLTNKNAI